MQSAFFLPDGFSGHIISMKPSACGRWRNSMDSAVIRCLQAMMVRFLNSVVENFLAQRCSSGLWLLITGYNWPLQSSKHVGFAPPTHLALSFTHMQIMEPLFVAIPGTYESQLMHLYGLQCHAVRGGWVGGWGIELSDSGSLPSLPLCLITASDHLP